ncbi:hypothetical protein, partial [Marinifilum sp. D737]|uniref:hypothetical protein n=1 Tax=Marinifilum sp. D737 TaxID=2969628 RepID=UPI0022732CA6|nr:hypothetical protein [Marinifilum sp. D737]
LTLSNGKYQEFHDLEDVVEIGSILYNTQTNQVVGFVQKDSLAMNVGMTPHLVSRWMCADPLSEEYSSWSPYNYTMNNPIKFIDPDGQKVVLAGGATNRHVSGKTLMQIAATNKGGAKLNALIGHKSTFTVGRSWSYRGNTYDPGKGNISYTSTYGALYSLREKEIGTTNTTVRLGHEMNHAYDLRDVPFYMANPVAENNKESLEYNAVGFDNYLRDVYGISDKRGKYTFADGSVIGTPTNTNSEGEKITGFELLNFDANDPNSALLSPGNPLEATYQKIIGDGEAQTYWIRMSINKNNEISYQIYNSYEEFSKK